MPVGESWQRDCAGISLDLSLLNCLLELGQQGSRFSFRSACDHILP